MKNLKGPKKQRIEWKEKEDVDRRREGPQIVKRTVLKDLLTILDF